MQSSPLFGSCWLETTPRPSDTPAKGVATQDERQLPHPNARRAGRLFVSIVLFGDHQLVLPSLWPMVSNASDANRIASPKQSANPRRPHKERLFRVFAEGKAERHQHNHPASLAAAHGSGAESAEPTYEAWL